MGSIPYVRWFSDDWYGGVRRFNRLQRGAYHDLLMEQVQEPDSPGLTMDDIRSILDRDFDECWPVISVKFESEDGVHFFNTKMRSEIDRSRNYSNSRSRNRRKKNKLQKKHMKNTCKTYEEHMGTGTGTSYSSSSEGKCEGEIAPTWRTSFEVYLEECKQSYRGIIHDKKWIDQQQEFYPNVDLSLSLKKAYTNFWGTKEGWEYKKGKKKAKRINWRSTWANAIGLNKVYFSKESVAAGVGVDMSKNPPGGRGWGNIDE